MPAFKAVRERIAVRERALTSLLQAGLSREQEETAIGKLGRLMSRRELVDAIEAHAEKTARHDFFSKLQNNVVVKKALLSEGKVVSPAVTAGALASRDAMLSRGSLERAIRRLKPAPQAERIADLIEKGRTFQRLKLNAAIDKMAAWKREVDALRRKPIRRAAA
ncbi:MAG: hypothetical protein AB1626_04510 [Candidatus Micrarchaeota archaeon]